jgi:hypothetical protein
VKGREQAGNLVSALGYAGLAFVDRPWQGFVCSPSAAPVSQSREARTNF